MDIKRRGLEAGQTQSKRSIPIPAASRGEAVADDAMDGAGGIGVSYRKLFHNDDRAVLDRRRSAESYFREVVEKGRILPTEGRTMVSGVAESGGATVPEYYFASIYQSVMNQSICLPRCRVFPMLSGTLHVPAWDSESQADGFKGGINMEFVGEGNSFTLKNGKTRSNILQAFKANVAVNISRECFEDSNSLSSTLGPMLVYNVSQGFDEVILTGSGVGQPLGILRAPATVSYVRASASAISFADIVGMLSRLHPNFWQGAVWLANSSCIPMLANLRDTGNNNLWVSAQSGGAAAGLPPVFGIPLVFTDKLPALGTKGDLTLANFSQYAVGLRQGAQVEMTNSAYWLNDLLSFRCIMRLAGLPLLDTAITPRTGGSTLSAFVVLE